MLYVCLYHIIVNNEWVEFATPINLINLQCLKGKVLLVGEKEVQKVKEEEQVNVAMDTQ